ncbi:hypothetical protein IMG5_159610 [Ichthyophthirius multifiliis]|uniref:Uncharacterized protein n=1 Tax=Ichthyophthirius multifiliis TaxID=5932 RepID=G0QZS9_ICHMU|nr:hypothetical protein IMG5_159610 [Ichthyophthirius multifiliis]EGR29267.1 hypothetical protein IMG5_159610 [Ichthyophthirius multifiliis]|eukprot:XP_004030503.1 hypothetical protein IMG5_159610 [Ichthyophthirius multifiliis]
MIHYIAVNTHFLKYAQKEKIRKLGECQDYPYPKNKVDFEYNIDFNNNKNKQIQNVCDYEKNYQKNNLVNSSSVPFNFISSSEIPNPLTIHDLRHKDEKVCNMTKQIGSIYDYGRLFAPNFNPEYQQYYKNSRNAFNRNKGMCADTYNRAHTYGPGLKPFRKFK